MAGVNKEQKEFDRLTAQKNEMNLNIVLRAQEIQRELAGLQGMLILNGLSLQAEVYLRNQVWVCEMRLRSTLNAIQ